MSDYQAVWAKNMAKPRPNLRKVIILAMVFFGFLLVVSINGIPRPSNFQASWIPSRHHSSAIWNETFGFEKILVINLPDRDDRLIPLVDAANATDVTFTRQFGVYDKEVAPSEIPKGFKSEGNGKIGSFVAHVRTWKRMVAENLGSAIIMEADVDWDVRIRDSLASVAPAIRRINDFPFDQERNKQDERTEPYGDGWDVLWLGNCGMAGRALQRQVIIPDPSTPPFERECRFGDYINLDQRPQGTRSVFHFTHGLCTYAYAVSQQGARKLIKAFEEGDGPVDIRISKMCEKEYNFKCLGVYPAIFSSVITESTIDNSDDEDAYKKKQENAHQNGPVVSAGMGIQVSARVNAAAIMNGTGLDGLVSQWDGEWVDGDDGIRHLVPTKQRDAKGLSS